MMTAKEAREVIDKVKTAMETAYDFFKNSGNYRYIKNSQTPEEQKVIAEFIYTFFEFDENGEITGLCEPTINLYLKIKEFKGI